MTGNIQVRYPTEIRTGKAPTCGTKAGRKAYQACSGFDNLSVR